MSSGQRVMMMLYLVNTAFVLQVLLAAAAFARELQALDGHAEKLSPNTAATVAQTESSAKTANQQRNWLNNVNRELASLESQATASGAAGAKYSDLGDTVDESPRELSVIKRLTSQGSNSHQGDEIEQGTLPRSDWLRDAQHTNRTKQHETFRRQKRQSLVNACGGIYIGSGIIRSHSLYERYPDNLNCAWTLYSEYKSGIFLEIRRFSTETCCDFVEISNRTGIQLRLSGEIHPLNVSLGSTVTVSFTTDGSVASTGFEIAFSSIPRLTVHNCGQTYFGSGIIWSNTLQEGQEYYPFNFNCTWTLRHLDAGSEILLEIRHFSTEAGRDFVEIFNLTGVQLRLSGEIQPQNVSLGSPVTVSFTSDGSVVGTGFEIAFSTAPPFSGNDCGGTHIGSGTIRLNSLFERYPHNFNCMWTLQSSTVGRGIFLEIRKVLMESCCDFVEISTELGLELRLSGEAQPQNVSLGSPVVVRFTRNGPVSRAVFEIAFSSIPPFPVVACGGTFETYDYFRNILSPNYPESYPNGVNCSWTLKHTSCTAGIYVDIRHFSTESCCDFVRISSASGQQHSLSGVQQPRIIYLELPVTVSFTTDGSGTSTGFRLGIGSTSKFPGKDCGGTFVGSGTIRSPNYPGNYPNNANCTWTLELSSCAAGIYLEILRFSTQSCCDFVRISNTSGQQLSLSGEQQLRIIYLGSRATVSFTTDGSGTSTGFEIAFGNECGGTVVGSGTIRSPAFPGSYPNNIHCVWTLQPAPSADKIFLEIRRFSTETGSDVVRISNESGQQLSLSGDQQPQNISLESSVTVSFTTDDSVTGIGFEFAFNSIPLFTGVCGGTLVGSGTIQSPNFPRINYPHSLNCVWTLQPSSEGVGIYVEIRSFSTELCCDFVQLSNTSGQQLSLSGDHQPLNISLGSTATVFFTTDGSVSRMGFELTFRTIPRLSVVDACQSGSWGFYGEWCFTVDRSASEETGNGEHQSCNSKGRFSISVYDDEDDEWLETQD